MNLYARVTRKLAKTSAMRWTLSKVLMPLDMRFKGTRFAPSTFGGQRVPLCYLTATGAASGEPRTVPLLYVPVGDGAVAVVASNFGGERHPAWSANLDAQPRATLEIDGTTHDVAARRANNEEAAAIWERFDHIWPGYERYREIAPREIRVYVLERC